MEKSSRRLRRQIREKMSSDTATGCLLRETEAYSETRRSCASLTGSPVCKQAVPLTTPIPALRKGPRRAAGSRESRGSQGSVLLLFGGQVLARHLLGAWEGFSVPASNPLTPVPLSIHGAGFTLWEGDGPLQPSPNPFGNKTKTPSYPTGNGNWRLFPVPLGTYETS